MTFNLFENLGKKTAALYICYVLILDVLYFYTGVSKTVAMDPWKCDCDADYVLKTNIVTQKVKLPYLE